MEETHRGHNDRMQGRVRGCGKEKGGSGGQLIPRLESAHRYHQSRCTASVRHQISTGRTLDKFLLFTSSRPFPNVTQTQGLCSEGGQALGGYVSHTVRTPGFFLSHSKGLPLHSSRGPSTVRIPRQESDSIHMGVGVLEMLLTGGQQHPNPTIGEDEGLVSCELLML